MVPAILVKDKVVTGSHHGDAFSKLNNEEKNDSQLLSGFMDCDHFKFVTEDTTIYLKEIIILRHAQSDLRINNGCITYKGRAQAFRAAEFLKGLYLENYQGFCSPYLRCQQTSAIIKEVCEIPFDSDLHFRKRDDNEPQEDFHNRIIEALDILPEKSILITHCDCIQNILEITNLIKENLNIIANCSITYIHQNRLVWLAREVNTHAKENRS